MGRDNQFSYEAKKIIFDYLEQYEDETGGHIKLDVIGICCDFAEMTEVELRQNYSIDDDVAVSDFLEDNTSFLGFFDGNDGLPHYVFQQF
jgi:hypothetical protein